MKRESKTYLPPCTRAIAFKDQLLALTGSMNANPTVGSKESNTVWSDEDILED